MQEQVRSFHKKNPKVWRFFAQFTFELIHRGFSNGSVNAVFERIRWETDEADSEGNSIFKLNNNYRSFYARAFMKKYPEHNGFFRTRKQTSKDEQATGLPELGPDFFDQ